MKKILFVLAICFFVTKTLGQQYNFRNYSVEDGVAQSQVYAVLQDSRGYMWFGTRGGGLSRFDGNKFKTFTERDGLINNYIYCLLEDKEKRIWIGTNTGISIYDGVRFRSFAPKGYKQQIVVYRIAEEQDGKKWLATNVGLFSFENGKFYNETERFIGKTLVNTVYIDPMNRFWFGTSEGLYELAFHNHKPKIINYAKRSRFMHNSITSIRMDAGGNLWIGTYGDGLYVYNFKSFYRIDLKQELLNQTILDIYFHPGGAVWLATLTKGVAQYNPITKELTFLTENEGISNNHVRSICRDNNGNIWFGTSGGGVSNYYGKQFTNYDKNNGLSASFIYSVYRDSRNCLWMGTGQKGVCKLENGVVTRYGFQNNFRDTKVKAICEDNFGNMYFGTDGQGLYIYDGISFEAITGMERKYIRAIRKDKNGDLWIATAGNGLYKYILSGVTPELKNFSTKDGLLFNRINCLHIDRLNRVWYGTDDQGMGFIENDAPSTNYLRRKHGLPSNNIRSMAEDVFGNLWIGTAGKGIAKIKIYENNPNIFTYNQQDGLTSANIYLLTFDRKNHLIIGSETGLDYIYFRKDGKINQVKHYSKGDGFTGVETCQNAVFNDFDGTIWFGTIKGLSQFNPDNLIKNGSEPIMNLLDVKLFYKSISSTRFKAASGEWNHISKLSLPYDQNHLTFDFFAVNLSNPEDVRYKWKLSGFDENWSPASTERSVMYPNINPGTYTFYVKACNEDGVWNKIPLKVRIIIATPYWMQWWFWFTVGLLFLLLVAIIFKWQTNRIRKKATMEQNQLQMEKEIVELEQKALRLQMNPHFIFNALNSIQSQIGTGNEQQARYYLAKFSRLMRQILDNSRNTLITLEQEVSTLENYLLIEQFCNGNRFDYAIETDPEIELDFVKIPPMLLQPFVENSIKHGMKLSDGVEERGNILIEFREKETYLECSVTDNGIGRKKAAELNLHSKETYHESTALKVTQERLNLLQPVEGVEPLEIIDLYHEDGTAKGTKVIVRVPIV